MNELCLALIKPDGVARGLTGAILDELLSAGVTLAGMKVVQVSQSLAENHYAVHQGKHYYDYVVDYLRGAYHGHPVVHAFCFHGESACMRIRQRIGTSDPMASIDLSTGPTIRQKYGRHAVHYVGDKESRQPDGSLYMRWENVVHASEPGHGEYEVKLWFTPAELLEEKRIYPVFTDSVQGLIWATSATEICKPTL